MLGCGNFGRLRSRLGNSLFNLDASEFGTGADLAARRKIKAAAGWDKAAETYAKKSTSQTSCSEFHRV